MHAAVTRFTTLLARVEGWFDAEAGLPAMVRRWERYEVMGREQGAPPDRPPRAGPIVELRARLWADRQRGTGFKLESGDCDSFSPDEYGSCGKFQALAPGSLVARPFHPLLGDPMNLAAGFDLEAQGEAVQAGRPTLRLGAVPRQVPFLHPHSMLAGEADAYELLIDTEVGILLSAEARVEERPYWHIAFTELELGSSLEGYEFGSSEMWPRVGVIEPPLKAHPDEYIWVHDYGAEPPFNLDAMRRVDGGWFWEGRPARLRLSENVLTFQRSGRWIAIASHLDVDQMQGLASSIVL